MFFLVFKQILGTVDDTRHSPTITDRSSIASLANSFVRCQRPLHPASPRSPSPGPKCASRPGNVSSLALLNTSTSTPCTMYMAIDSCVHYLKRYQPIWCAYLRTRSEFTASSSILIYFLLFFSSLTLFIRREKLRNPFALSKQQRKFMTRSKLRKINSGFFLLLSIGLSVYRFSLLLLWEVNGRAWPVIGIVH